MKKINWKVRMKNPLWWAQIGLAVFTPILAYTGLNFEDITTWAALGNILLGALLNPYILGLVAVSVFNAVTDPTTAGIADSARALAYEQPTKGETNT